LASRAMPLLTISPRSKWSAWPVRDEEVLEPAEVLLLPQELRVAVRAKVDLALSPSLRLERVRTSRRQSAPTACLWPRLARKRSPHSRSRRRGFLGGSGPQEEQFPFQEYRARRPELSSPNEEKPEG